MLHAPVSDKRTKPEANRSEVEQEPERSQGLTRWGDRSTLGAGQSPVTATQQAFGNQAALRMMRGQQERSPVVNPVQGGLLQRKCACGNAAGAAGTCAECQGKQERSLQTKLRISEPGDRYEQEADRIADQVMRMPSSTIQRQVSPATKDVIQTKATDQQMPALASSLASSDVPSSVDEVLASSGQPLDSATCSFMEPRFGHDFSQVRVHTGTAAERSAQEVNAHAYTVNHNIVFSSGKYKPTTDSGKQLLAHELVHVIQQSRNRYGVAPIAKQSTSQQIGTAEQKADRVAIPEKGSSIAISQINAAPPALARKVLDISQIDQIINLAMSAVPQGLGWLPALLPQIIGHQQGGIGFAANYPGGVTPTKQPTVPVPKADKAPVPRDANLPIEAHFFPSGRLQSTERALILGGFHGDEQPGWQVVEALVSELSAPPKTARPLFFHTIVVPRVNAGAIADELKGLRFWDNRCNRQGVDLNRNFPIKNGTPKDTHCVNTVKAPIQPEVQGVIDLIKTFKPDRILSTHSISNLKEAGVFADPNTDPAAIALARGMASTITDPSNRPFNKLTDKNFNPIYPKDTPGKVSGGTSLGAFAPTATGGTIPVITMEAPKDGALTPTGTRSIEAFLRPTRAFLTDPALLNSKADEDILTDIDSFTGADRIGFLTGRLPLANKIYDRIRLRVNTAVAKLNSLKPPRTVKVVSGLRLSSEAVPGSTGGSAQAKIIYNKFFLRGSFDTESFPTRFFQRGDRSKGINAEKWLAEPPASRLAIILQFSALPGASRHHWGTEVDFNSTTEKDWEPPTAPTGKPGSLFDLGVWLQANAAKVGFFQAYTPGRTGGYNEEAWHYSYAPIAIGLRQRYNAQVNLSTDVADAFLTDMKTRAKVDRITVPTDLDAAVKALKISDFVNTIDPGL